MKTVSHIIAATLLTTGVAAANDQIRFEEQDTNRDGYISQSEWRDARVNVDFEQVDTNDDGMLTEQELQQFGQVQLDETSGKSAMTERVDFDRIDANRDDFASKDEWQDAQLNVDFDEIDSDQDGYVSRDELERSERVELKRAGRYGMQHGDRKGMKDTDMKDMRGMHQQGQQAGNQSKMLKNKDQSFQQADRDRDQRVSRQEAADAGHDYVVMYFEPLDMNRDNYLDEEEWTQSARPQQGTRDASAQGQQSQQEARETAQSMDRDRDNYISEQEAAADGYVVSHFESWDTDRDGYVDIAVVERALVEADDQQQDQQNRQRSQDQQRRQ